MNYYVYWSIQETPSHSITSEAVFLIVGVVCLLVWLLFKKYLRQKANDYDRTMALWACGILTNFSAIMFLFLHFFADAHDNKEIARILNSRQTKVVEGRISGFRRHVEYKRLGAITTESFLVDSIYFEYSDALLGRFNTFSKTNNNVFHNGLPVRITYINGNRQRTINDNWILIVEVSSKSFPSSHRVLKTFSPKRQVTVYANTIVQ